VIIVDKKNKEFLTVEEFAGILRVSKNTVYQWIKKGKLKVVKIGRRNRIPASELEAKRMNVEGAKK